MKVIIAGSRGICYDHAIKRCDYRQLGDLVDAAVAASGFQITEVVSGNARGPDMAGEQWAQRNGVPVRVFKPDWKHRGSGKQRNGDMALYCDAAIVLWDGVSPGTADMIAKMKRAGKPHHVERTDR